MGTYNIAINGSIEITSTAFYITLPVLATWLLGFREAFWTAAICLGSALILVLRQEPSSVLPTAPLRPPLLIWANLVQLTLTAAAPLAHPNFGQPQNNLAVATFGQITATRTIRGDLGSSRQIQFALKLLF